MQTYSVSEEVYTHEYLWRAATKIFEEAVASERPSYHFLLPALLVSYMAYEAFINFCGHVLLPELWREEKKHFKGKSTEDKLESIASRLPAFVWRKGEPPYQLVKKLEDFRDMVAHGKVQASRYATVEKGDGPWFQFAHTWDAYLTIGSVTEARGAILSFCQALLVELRKCSDHPHLGADAFRGSLASGSAGPSAG